MKKLFIVSSLTVAVLFAAGNIHEVKHTVYKTVHHKKHHYVVENLGVEFKAGSYTLTKEDIIKVEKFAKFLKKHPKYRVEIIGFTDNKGNKKYNLWLSTKRAKAVYEELIKLGISKKRLRYKGEGSLHPIASNKTAKGRAENRRVVAVIIK
jgi:OOP family OmpA-OmpF porin